MNFPDTFKLTTPSNCEIQVTRDFDAPRARVFDAFTKPELIRQWLLGPPGWTMPVCEVNLRVGGVYRYVWLFEQDGSKMGISGAFRKITPATEIVATEKFDEAWYPGEAIVTTSFVETSAITKVTVTILYESQAARDTARRSGMEHGMAASYSRLESSLDQLRGVST